MKTTVTVFGADSLQGFSVASLLSTQAQYEVRALVLNAECERAQQLEKAGVAIFKGDLNDLKSLVEALHGADCCFVMTQTDFGRDDAIEYEVKQGKNAADACRECHVGHVVYNTQLNTKTAIGVVARHMVAKAEVEAYMICLQLPLTSLILPCMYEDLYTRLRPLNQYGYGLALPIPIGNLALDMISTEDLGHIVNVILGDRAQYLHKTVSCSGEKLTVREMCDTLTRCLESVVIRDANITCAQFAQQPLDYARDWAIMFDFFSRVDQKYNLNATKRMYPGLQSFEQWARSNVPKLLEAFLKNI